MRTKQLLSERPTLSLDPPRASKRIMALPKRVQQLLRCKNTFPQFGCSPQNLHRPVSVGQRARIKWKRARPPEPVCARAISWSASPPLPSPPFFSTDTRCASFLPPGGCCGASFSELHGGIVSNWKEKARLRGPRAGVRATGTILFRYRKTQLLLECDACLYLPSGVGVGGGKYAARCVTGLRGFVRKKGSAAPRPVCALAAFHKRVIVGKCEFALLEVKRGFRKKDN